MRIFLIQSFQPVVCFIWIFTDYSNMWAWENLFPENPKEEVEAMIDKNVCLTCPSTDTEAQTLDEPLDKTQSQDNPQPQDGTQTQDETKFQEESKSQDSEKKHGWIISKEEIPTFCKDHNCLLSDITEIPRATYGDIVARIEMDEPREELLEKAKLELGETQEVVDQSIKALKELLSEEEQKRGLRAPVDNEAWLKRFLRPTHYYPRSAFSKIKSYYEVKIKNDKHKELYNDLKPSKLENFFKNDMMTVLPMRDQDGRRVLVVEIGRRWNYKLCSLDEIYKGAVLFLEASLLEPETQISGAVIIFDMEGLKKWQIWQFTINPAFVLRVVELLQTAAPIRVKGIHIVNEPNIFGTLLKLFTALMEEKLKNRIHMHGKDRASLHKHIDANRLPPEYGGTFDVPRITGPEWLEVLSMLDKEYEEVNSYGYKKEIK